MFFCISEISSPSHGGGWRGWGRGDILAPKINQMNRITKYYDTQLNIL